jgi:hypothetical protein
MIWLLLICTANTPAQNGQNNPPPQTPGSSTAPPPQAQPRNPPPNSPGAQKSEAEKAEEKQEQSQRMLGVVPEFSVTSRLNASPLTGGQKFHLFAKSAFDPVEFVVVGAQAGVSQAENEFPGYGQGAAGFGKRYGATLADEVSSNFFSNYFWAVALKQDPRYFRLGRGTIKRRIFYSLEQELICHTDRGGRSFCFENVLGAFSAGGLSNVYYPSSDRGFGLTMSRASIALLYGSLGGLTDEFYTDIAQRLFHRRRKEAADAGDQEGAKPWAAAPLPSSVSHAQIPLRTP